MFILYLIEDIAYALRKELATLSSILTSPVPLSAACKASLVPLPKGVWTVQNARCRIELETSGGDPPASVGPNGRCENPGTWLLDPRVSGEGA